MKRNKTLCIAVTLFVLQLTLLHAQSAGIKKFPGETVTITWTNPTADDSKVTGWRIYSSSNANGPYTYTGVSVLASARQASLPAAFSTNSVMVFYAVRSYLVNGTATIESDPVPTTGVEVDMAVVSPTGVTGK